ncbi:4Fe-4S dicluster domain-containing protein, partial [Candidatus Bathyarchaeota archaeon]|nr:4Fe-4S dicluster domain-containing protein [Candidatus Bathyarchaeota archaeon]
MPMKTQKITTDNQLIIERRHHAKTYKLTIDQASCVGCELCSLICPREAIKVTKKPKIEGEKAERPTIDVDEAKCHYCGMCVAICPYGAVQVAVDGENISSVVEKESFPKLIREISVDTTKCPTDCKECEEVCPLNLIKIESNSIKAQVTVEILKERCPCCGLCDVKCPEGAIQVRRIFTGKLRIDQEKCPSECRDCLDACPITGALFLDEKDKIRVNELFCTYCGVCKIVCPEEGALELSRSTIRHTPIRSGAWNKALEKLASTLEVTKELRGKGKKRAMEAVKKRLETRR